MFHNLLAALNNEVSGAATKNLVARISQWHRIQASPMYREAAEWVHATLQGWGSPARSSASRRARARWPGASRCFRSGGATRPPWTCWSQQPPTNSPRRRLADYRAVPLSLMPRSSAAEGEYEVLVIDGGDRPEHYAGLDVRGKLVLTRLMPMAVHHLAIERFGAAGLIFDGMRSVPEVCPPGDLQDDIQYASWWWWGGETRAFGFALSPRVGAELRRMIARAGAPLRVRARVRSHFADGTIETVSAFIPGEIDEEVLITGHLCHPAPMANDNASGAAAVMEAARALHTLIASGALPTPRRGYPLPVDARDDRHLRLLGRARGRPAAHRRRPEPGHGRRRSGADRQLVAADPRLRRAAELRRAAAGGAARGLLRPGAHLQWPGRFPAVPSRGGAVLERQRPLHPGRPIGGHSVANADPVARSLLPHYRRHAGEGLAAIAGALGRAGRYLCLFRGQCRPARGGLAGARDDLSLRGPADAQAPERHHRRAGRCTARRPGLGAHRGVPA